MNSCLSQRRRPIERVRFVVNVALLIAFVSSLFVPAFPVLASHVNPKPQATKSKTKYTPQPQFSLQQLPQRREEAPRQATTFFEERGMMSQPNASTKTTLPAPPSAEQPRLQALPSSSTLQSTTAGTTPMLVVKTGTTMVEKIIPVMREVMETVVRTGERIVEKMVDVVKEVPRTVVETKTRLVDTVVPVTRQVTDYVTQKVEEAYQYPIQIVRNVVEQGKEWMREAYETVRQVPRQVTEWVTERVAEVQQVPRTVYDTVRRTKEWIEDKVSTVWETVGQWKNRVVEKIETVRDWVAAKYKTVTERTWGKTGESVTYKEKPVYQTVRQGGWSWLSGAWRWVTQTVQKVVGYVREKIVTPIYGWITNTYNKLVEAAHWVSRQVKNYVTETYWAVERVAKQVVEKVKRTAEWFEQVPRTVYDTVTQFVDRAKAVTKTVYDTVRETAYRMVEKPVQIVRQVVDTVMQTGTRLVDKIVPVVRTATDYVTKKVEETYQEAKTVFDRVVEKVSQMVRETYQYVADVAKKIVEDQKFRLNVKYVIVENVGRAIMVLPPPNPVVEFVAPQVCMLQGAGENVWDTVTSFGSLAYNSIFNSGATGEALKAYGAAWVEDPAGQLVNLGEGYVEDVTKRWGNGQSACDRGRAAGYVGFDVATTVFSGGAIGVVKNTGKSVAKNVGKQVAEEVAEKLAKETAERIAKEAVEKAVREAQEKAVKEAAEKAAKEAAVKAARETLNKVADAEFTRTGRYANRLIDETTLTPHVDITGKFYSLQKTSDGKLRNFVNAERHTPPSEIDYILKDGKLKFGKEHTYLSHGEPVEYAGKIKISSDGTSINRWDNGSGHYKPKADDIIAQQKVREAFKKELDIDLPAFTPFSP